MCRVHDRSSVSCGRDRCAALGLGMLACVAAQAASAADCPGHPDALGTSRTLVVDPREHPRHRHHAIRARRCRWQTMKWC